jgi:hypothetical protein
MTKPTVDPVGIYVGLMLATLTSFFAYAGAKGVWDHLHGSRADSADLSVSLFALASTPILVRLCLRLFGRHMPDTQLLAGPELLIASLFVLGGTVWSILDGWGRQRFAIAGLAIGCAGLGLWWFRRRTSPGSAQTHS